jgi:ABC-type branched-subunit amino acid transport system permease subunit
MTGEAAANMVSAGVGGADRSPATRRTRDLAGSVGEWMDHHRGLVELVAVLGSLVLVQRLVFGAPLGVVANGALVGGRIALIALGFALVYRANRIVNFAQAELGGVPATLATLLVVSWSWNYWLGFFGGLAAAVVLGVVVETLIVRRFFAAPRLVLTVATIGIAQVLTGAALLLPRAFDSTRLSEHLPQPFGATFDLSGTRFNATDILTMIAVPVAFLALALFLRFSTVGIAIVAAAERADRASTLGIPVRRLHTVVWVVATVLSFVAMFLRAGAVGLPVGEVLEPIFLVQALAAAVLGAFTRLPTVAAAGIGLGIVDQSMTFQDGTDPAYNYAVLFAIVLVALVLVRPGRRRAEPFPLVLAVGIGLAVAWAMVVQQDGTVGMLARPGDVDWSRISLLALWPVLLLVGLLAALARLGRNGGGRVDADASTWRATREVRPIPRELAGLPEVVATRTALWAVLGLFLLTLPLWLSDADLGQVTVIVLFGIVAASLVVLSGWAGQVSLGHMAFVGLGAAVGGALTQSRDWDLLLSMLAAGLVGAAAAVVVGYPALRRGGLTLAVATLGFALFTWQYLLNAGIFDWLPEGRIDPPTLLGSISLTGENNQVAATRLYFVALATLGLTLLMVTGLRRSRTGRVLIAIRENEAAARAYGVNASRTMLAAFALSGFLAAVAGALLIHYERTLAQESYIPQRSLELFSMVVIGGLGSLPGALLGATYVQGADFFLPDRWQYLASGAGLLLVLLMFPAGLGSLLSDLRDGALRRIARRRGLVVPSLLADVRVDAGDGATASPGPGIAGGAGEPEPEPEPRANGDTVTAGSAEPAGADPADAEPAGADPADAEPAGADADAEVAG